MINYAKVCLFQDPDCLQDQEGKDVSAKGRLVYVPLTTLAALLCDSRLPRVNGCQHITPQISLLLLYPHYSSPGDRLLMNTVNVIRSILIDVEMNVGFFYRVRQVNIGGLRIAPPGLPRGRHTDSSPLAVLESLSIFLDLSVPI